jgi:putative ABC transport system ATP-binding protein
MKCLESFAVFLRRGAEEAEASALPGPVRPAPIFRIVGLTKEYPSPEGPVVPLHEATIAIGEGVTAVVGPNGQGKTTLLNCLGGLDTPTAGRVFFKGQLLDYRDGPMMRRYRAERVAYIFQDLNLVNHQTARENVALPLLCRGWFRGEALAEADYHLNAIGLANLADRLPCRMSRGQRQRVSIARAFCAGAEVILADEPTASLDEATAAAVMEAFCDLARQRGTPVLLVTHAHALARRYCDRILECQGGRLFQVHPAPLAMAVDAFTS